MARPPAALLRALEKEPWPSVILVAGEDGAARQAAIHLIEQHLPDETPAIDRFEDEPLARVLDTARTAPLLGGRRLVVVRLKPGLLDGEEGRQTLLDYLDSPAEHAVLVLDSPKIDKRLKWVKVVAKRGLVVECSKPREREMPGWIEGEAREVGVRLRGDAIQLLADCAGTDTGLARRELEKIALVATPGDPPLGAAEIEPLLSPGRTAGAFALEDALLAGRCQAALTCLHRHLEGSSAVAPLALLARLAGICRRLAVAAEVRARGGGEGEVQAALGCHPFVARKYSQAVDRRSIDADRALAACVAADGRLKSGGAAATALEAVVLATCSPPGGLVTRARRS
ncbi:MAG: DNA polymerase III subunit delta [Acidobacteriota bacterium]|nr:DNA polymerase III subunit delta [Acidobacteriota bacterium]MDQ7087256.1 DNA polymerase III subunit delta [Acidobacteriota bacterium]